MISLSIIYNNLNNNVIVICIKKDTLKNIHPDQHSAPTFHAALWSCYFEQYSPDQHSAPTVHATLQSCYFEQYSRKFKEK